MKDEDEEAWIHQKLKSKSVTETQCSNNTEASSGNHIVLSNYKRFHLFIANPVIKQQITSQHLIHRCLSPVHIHTAKMLR